MTDLQEFERWLRADLAATARSAVPTPDAAERAIGRAREASGGRPARAGWGLRWAAPLAAAAVAILVISTTVLAVQARHANRPGGSVQSAVSTPAPTMTPPSTPLSTTPPPTPTSSAPSPVHLQVVDGIHPATCPAIEPGKFPYDLNGASVPVPPGVRPPGMPILSVTAAGEVLATSPAIHAKLYLVTASGQMSTLYTAQDIQLATNETAAITAAQGDARWVAFAVSTGSAGQMAVRQLAVVDRSDGHVAVIHASPSFSPEFITGPVLFRDLVFWTEVDNGGNGSVYRYDPGSGKTTTVGSGTQLSALAAIGGGLYWQQDGHTVTYAAGELPAGYRLDTNKLTAPVSDGVTSVWATTTWTSAGLQLEIMLSRLGNRAPMVIYEGSADQVDTPLAVAGPYVLWRAADEIHMLDTRTGAVQRIVGVDPMTGTAAAGGGVLAVNTMGSMGGQLLYFGAVASLPEFHC